MRAIQIRLGLLLVGVLLCSACGGPSGIPGEEPPTVGTGEAPPPCGNLPGACAASEYCLVSSIPRLGRPELILTSECVPLAGSSCPVLASRDELCACLIDDAKVRNSNCARAGTAFSCDVHTQSDAASPRLGLTCGVTNGVLHGPR